MGHRAGPQRRRVTAAARAARAKTSAQRAGAARAAPALGPAASLGSRLGIGPEAARALIGRGATG